MVNVFDVLSLIDVDGKISLLFNSESCESKIAFLVASEGKFSLYLAELL